MFKIKKAITKRDLVDNVLITGFHGIGEVGYHLLLQWTRIDYPSPLKYLNLIGL